MPELCSRSRNIAAALVLRLLPTGGPSHSKPGIYLTMTECPITRNSPQPPAIYRVCRRSRHRLIQPIGASYSATSWPLSCPRKKRRRPGQADGALRPRAMATLLIVGERQQLISATELRIAFDPVLQERLGLYNVPFHHGWRDGIRLCSRALTWWMAPPDLAIPTQVGINFSHRYRPSAGMTARSFNPPTSVYARPAPRSCHGCTFEAAD
jgi:hypothetical protein